MSEVESMQLIALLGWLILAGSALAAYRLDWRRGVKLGLIWAAIFAAAFLIGSWLS